MSAFTSSSGGGLALRDCGVYWLHTGRKVLHKHAVGTSSSPSSTSLPAHIHSEAHSVPHTIHIIEISVYPLQNTPQLVCMLEVCMHPTPAPSPNPLCTYEDLPTFCTYKHVRYVVTDVFALMGCVCADGGDAIQLFDTPDIPLLDEVVGNFC